jgi:hypothetical protein
VTISTAHTGRSYNPYKPYPITRTKVDEFLVALAESNPAYEGDEAVVPPTFAAVATFENWRQLIEDPELGLALKRLIHAEQTFEFVRPLRVGEVLEGWTTLDDIKIRGPLEYLFVRVEVRNSKGEFVGTSRSTFIHNRAAAEAEEAAAS